MTFSQEQPRDPPEPAPKSPQGRGATAAARAGDAVRSATPFKAFRVGLTGALGVGVGLLVWGAVTSLSTLLTYIGIALFVALGMDPAVNRLQSRGVPRGAAVALVFTALTAVVAALLIWTVPVLIAQVRMLIERVPVFLAGATDTAWVNDVEQVLVGYLDIDALADSLASFLSDPANLMALGGGVLAVGAGLANGVTGVIIVLILSLYFVASLGSIKRAGYQLVPASKRKQFVDVSEDIAASVSRYIVGQFNLSLINGVLSMIFLSLISAPIPLLLAIVAFLGSLIPLIGTVAAAAIITFVCFVTSPQTALIAGIYYLIYMQVEAYILTPRIMRKAVDVPGALVVIAAVAGGTLGGILGALVAIPLAASGIIIVQKVVVPRQNQR